MNTIASLTTAEQARQRMSLNLIASENYASPAVLSALGSVWQNKYAEGYPGKRYYAGNAGADELETYVQQLALNVFASGQDYGVNVQVLSGSPANAAIYLTSLDPGDTIMSLDLAGGGHLSHLHPTSAYLKYYRHSNYGVKATPAGFEIDLDDFQMQLETSRPKLVIIGFSAYPAQYKFAPLIELAHAAGALVLADIAHIAGLVATGDHDTPFQIGQHGADFITMTTHKTLRGPRGALVFAKSEWMEQLNQTIFPGTSGGPHLHQIAAVGQALLEITGDSAYPDKRSFNDYIKDVINTTHALELGLAKGGLSLVTPSATHLSLVKLPAQADSLKLQRLLEQHGIMTNRNQIPFDAKTAWRPSGLRLGTAALTSRGLTTADAAHLGELIAALTLGDSHTSIKAELDGIRNRLSWYY
jgi:glycine hydroxymethyltransferase